jgi:hypothetical protein
VTEPHDAPARSLAPNSLSARLQLGGHVSVSPIVALGADGRSVVAVLDVLSRESVRDTARRGRIAGRGSGPRLASAHF